MFFPLSASMWRNASKYGLLKKKIVKTTRLLIYNLKFLPFLEHQKVKEFYNKIKDYFIGEVFLLFYNYFQYCWLNLSEDNKEKYKFDIWNYTGKFNFRTNKKI